MMQTLWALAQIFTQLSVLAFGGGNTILPEMQRQVVDVHGWMTAADFSALFALGRRRRGPISWWSRWWAGTWQAGPACWSPPWPSSGRPRSLP